jgi:hypothetical protein
MGTAMNSLLLDTAGRGERIYRKRFMADYEQSFPGMYVVIEVNSERSFLAENPETALREAMTALPDGRFHLIKVGAQAVFKVGYSRCGTSRGDRSSE